ncbi:MAG: methyl-accepting chemotaxis protein, partial [Bacteroidales bacterium]|nr:methyl-accepting chemotaxis protein [Bacteroidales bacterium]
MKRYKDFSIGSKLNLLLSSLFAIIVFIAGSVISFNLKKNIIKDTDTRMYEQLLDLTELVANEIENNNREVMGIANLAFLYFVEKYDLGVSLVSENVEVENQETKKRENVSLNFLTANQNSLHQDYAVVDEIKEKTGAYSTVFQKIPLGYLRISTNILTDSKERAIKTYIPNSSPVAQALEQGKEYTGRAFVVNDWYLTVYKPIYVNGKVNGAFFIGLPEKDLTAIREFIVSKKYFESGYPYILGKDGIVVVHPKSEGLNVANTELYKQMSSYGDGINKISYVWEGKKKIQYFNTIPAINSWIAVSVYEEELFDVINQSGLLVGAVLVAGFVLFFLANRLISRYMSKNIEKGVNFAEDIANGNLYKALNINQQDEIGTLASALNKMQGHLKQIVGNISNGAHSLSGVSAQISAGAQQFSQGANEQSATVEEISAAMEEMAAAIDQNSQNAAQSEKLASDARASIHEVVSRSKQAIDVNKKVAD